MHIVKEYKRIIEYKGVTTEKETKNMIFITTLLLFTLIGTIISPSLSGGGRPSHIVRQTC